MVQGNASSSPRATYSTYERIGLPASFDILTNQVLALYYVDIRRSDQMGGQDQRSGGWVLGAKVVAKVNAPNKFR